MSNKLNWPAENGELMLSGELDCDTLLPFWDIRQQILTADIHTLNVSALSRVDSAGLAMLVHILDEASVRQQPLTLIGVTAKLQMLIDLYNLRQIIQPYLVSSADRV
ncbi:MAG: lipid asymmetry maintenance protein MlaB [Enterobacteriaceae bacterium]|jgi:phospholipid transport system transporter-binding protein|nr:lipid asymmetry maintenance protein MlaB [Enterobacteriaceae bacterium]